MFVLATATDSLELSFAKDVLLLTDSEYGFLVSIAGAGFILGAITNTILSKKLAPSFLIGIGSLFIAIGYLIYAFSNVFLINLLLDSLFYLSLWHMQIQDFIHFTKIMFPFI